LFWGYAAAVEPPPPSDELLARVNQAFCQGIPHNRALGMRMLRFEPGLAVGTVPWDERLVGNTELRILHGGAITTLLDATCGAAVFSRLTTPVPIATLDLRIDYLGPAAPDRDVLARAECYKLTRNVAFVRAVAYQGEPEDPIASASGTFMISSPGPAAGRG